MLAASSELANKLKIFCLSFDFLEILTKSQQEKAVEQFLLREYIRVTGQIGKICQGIVSWLNRRVKKEFREKNFRGRKSGLKFGLVSSIRPFYKRIIANI